MKKSCQKVCSYQHCVYLYNMNDNKNTEIMKTQVKKVNDYRNNKRSFSLRMQERGRDRYMDEFNKLDNILDKIEMNLICGISLERQMEMENEKYDDLSRPHNTDKWHVLIDLTK